MLSHIDDVAVLHFAAAMDPEILQKGGVRIQAWSGKGSFNWNDVFAIFRRIRPNHAVPDDLPDNPKLLITTDDTEARRLLQKWAGRDWKTLDEGVAESIDGLS
jgi:hypothetical protein